jgi:nitric oxide dioxygenase
MPLRRLLQGPPTLQRQVIALDELGFAKKAGVVKVDMALQCAAALSRPEHQLLNRDDPGGKLSIDCSGRMPAVGFSTHMTPAQITLVEETMASIDVDRLAGDFYRRAFASDPTLTAMFTTDPDVQRARFGAELAEIVRSIRTLDRFGASVRSLGAMHREYGVRAAHYRLMGEELLPAWRPPRESWTAETAEAWKLAYNLTAETMMLGALEEPATD